ncbi:MAG: redoxin domain-containing protein [Nitrospiraceae bacterium]
MMYPQHRHRVSMRRTWMLSCALACLVAVGLSSFAWSMGGRVPAVGMPAADFQLVDLDGKSRTLSDYRGKLVVLNFWATWCKPCTAEMPAMQAAYERLKDKGLVVVAVNELENETRVRQHIAEYGHTFPVLLDRNNSVANLYGVFGLPVTVFIDGNGIVQEYVKGSLLTEQKIQDVFERVQAKAGLRASLR